MPDINFLINGLSEEKIELISKLINIYGENLVLVKEKLKKIIFLLKEFKNLFNEKEVHIIRAPGRVNLIGEHTDYNGLPVLPMAIDRDIILVVSLRKDNKIILKNISKKFPPREFLILQRIPPFPTGDWGNYCKAAIQGIIDYKKVIPSGMNILLNSDIPEEAGLSSSSAVVVAYGIAATITSKIKIASLKLAELLAHAERYVGTEGGGMDQATSLLGKRECALKIDFFPLRVQPVKLPQEYAFVICHSLIKAGKSKEVRMFFNQRVIACRLAVVLLNRFIFKKKSIKYLGEIKEILDEKKITKALGKKNEKLSIKQIASRLEINENEILKKYCTLKNGNICEEPKEGFPIRNRFEHVISEGKRVKEAFNALTYGKFLKFGKLMDVSHQSCRDNYEVSCKELDLLVNLAKKANAIGARLTGAGFGGCTVNLVKKENVEKFKEYINKYYYKKYFKTTKNYIYVFKAVKGACELF